MKNYDVESFHDLHKAIFEGEEGKRKFRQWVFRGQKTQPPAFELLPTIGRKPFNEPGFIEPSAHVYWKLKAKDILRTFGCLSEIESLCLAQQHGCPTRLLDWSYSPLVAAYFAVREDWDDDSFIYCLDVKSDFIKAADDKIDPFNFNEDIRLYDPGSLTPQIKSQLSIVTIHNDPTIPLTKLPSIKDDMVEQITIKRSYRRKLLEELSFYNVHVWTMYPDLNGLGNRIAWSTKNTIERAQVYLEELRAK